MHVALFKVGLTPSKKSLFHLLQLKPFKNGEKCFLLHLKSSFLSRDIFLSRAFDHVEKTA